jgi:hypothetical protein
MNIHHDQFSSVTPLEESRTSAAHRERMTRCLEEFSAWLTTQGLTFHDATQNWPLASGCLAHYIQFCRSRGAPILKARYAVLGVQTAVRSLKGHLRRAWDGITAWEAELPNRNRLPLPEVVVLSAALMCVELARDHARHSEALWCLAVLLRIGFHGMLRPGELRALTYDDLLFPPRDGTARPPPRWDPQTEEPRFLGQGPVQGCRMQWRHRLGSLAVS